MDKKKSAGRPKVEGKKTYAKVEPEIIEKLKNIYKGSTSDVIRYALLEHSADVAYRLLSDVVINDIKGLKMRLEKDSYSYPENMEEFINFKLESESEEITQREEDTIYCKEIKYFRHGEFEITLPKDSTSHLELKVKNFRRILPLKLKESHDELNDLNFCIERGKNERYYRAIYPNEIKKIDDILSEIYKKIGEISKLEILFNKTKSEILKYFLEEKFWKFKELSPGISLVVIEESGRELEKYTKFKELYIKNNRLNINKIKEEYTAYNSYLSSSKNTLKEKEIKLNFIKNQLKQLENFNGNSEFRKKLRNSHLKEEEILLKSKEYHKKNLKRLEKKLEELKLKLNEENKNLEKVIVPKLIIQKILKSIDSEIEKEELDKMSYTDLTDYFSNFINNIKEAQLEEFENLKEKLVDSVEEFIKVLKEIYPKKKLDVIQEKIISNLKEKGIIYLTIVNTFKEKSIIIPSCKTRILNSDTPISIEQKEKYIYYFDWFNDIGDRYNSLLVEKNKMLELERKFCGELLKGNDYQNYLEEINFFETLRIESEEEINVLDKKISKLLDKAIRIHRTLPVIQFKIKSQSYQILS